MEKDERTENGTERVRPPIGGSSILQPGQIRGAWVTLHMLPTVGDTKTVVGYMTGAENGMLKLTKFVTTGEGNVGPRAEYGLLTAVYDGVWLINPAHVWMIEHEKEIPTPGFTPYQA